MLCIQTIKKLITWSIHANVRHETVLNGNVVRHIVFSVGLKTEEVVSEDQSFPGHFGVERMASLLLIGEPILFGTFLKIYGLTLHLLSTFFAQAGTRRETSARLEDGLMDGTPRHFPSSGVGEIPTVSSDLSMD